tara:strand:- start:28 stop:231 length:204 start_codon:yes stop_codon:yes gene_type:complete
MLIPFIRALIYSVSVSSSTASSKLQDESSEWSEPSIGWWGGVDEDDDDDEDEDEDEAFKTGTSYSGD